MAYSVSLRKRKNMEDEMCAMDGMTIGGGGYDKQTFGAAVVSKTLDYMNGVTSSPASSAPMDKETFGAAVVSKTLDYMNGPVFGKGDPVSHSYQFNKDVMGPVYSGVGSIVDIYS
ncbi:hypothetical protein [Oleidesulfovibrio sp.]|uniref:hypothetical protein n=1 Tax=Oleidesulfovibrio sp. TaxID=2909707 RepID=UPI003A8BE9FC